MKQLTIEHLAPYLPYGLKVKDAFNGKIYEIQNGEMMDYILLSYRKNSKAIHKIILHPLSDLTKEIEHNGERERFVPIEKLNELYGYEEVKLTTYLNDQNIGWAIFASHANTAIGFDDMYKPIQKLFEWHFDVFSLREKNLCIYYDEITK